MCFYCMLCIVWYIEIVWCLKYSFIRLERIGYWGVEGN